MFLPALVACVGCYAWGMAAAPDAPPPGPVPPRGPGQFTQPATPAPEEPMPDSIEAPPAQDLTVGRVSVAGTLTADTTRVLRTFEIQPGSHFSEDLVKRGIRKLFALGLFSDVYVEPIEHEGTVDLVVHVSERPRIGTIQFRGNHKKSNGDLEKKLVIHTGEPFQPTVVETQVDSLLRFYHNDGYARATIAVAADTLAAKNEVTLTFQIQEGEKVKIQRITFQGVTALDPARLHKTMKSHPHGFFGGGEVKDENFAEDAAKIEALYHDSGYRDARVTGHDLLPGTRPDRLVYQITVDEGPQYSFGNVSWSGNEAVPTSILEHGWRSRHGGDSYDQSRIERAVGNAYSEYAERGYLYLSVEPAENVHGDTVDVAFQVTEGRPSRVRYVNISGNKGTRENVIRREIGIHEGDRFKRSSLVRTQGDLMRLGLFEDVAVDFAPVESTDVDIDLKVKEKQVGTASAGAGYTSQTGVTGFLELGHNNVLGNGQSVNIHLERGGKREDYNLSFTEPWFRGTPTLLGFSLFNTYQVLDLYNERRSGGSARIGRPLPWPDYSRGSISYQLENVRITALGDTLTPADSAVLVGVQIGKPVLTSSVDLEFSRNSTDNPFYPTRGTRLILSSTLAGGPFGGAVNYNKNRLEGRLYLPSILRGITTMVRVRWGILSPYLDQQAEVPPYERFRLGGGTTIDPLRGYDDYEVVPGKFQTSVQEFRPLLTLAGADSLGPDGKPILVSAGYRPVRYPGGRFMSVYTFEQQFPIVHPLHGVVFFDAGNTWDLGREVKPFQLKTSVGLGFRMEIPMLGNIGFDYGFGFDREDFNSFTGTYHRHGRFKGHFLIGNLNF